MLTSHATKFRLLVLVSCLVFFTSACQNIPPTSTVHQTSTAPTSASITTTGSASSCAVHTPSMPALSERLHPGILYLSERGGLQTAMTDARLLRYDLTIKSKTTLLFFANSDQGIDEAQLSTDRQWVLFLTTSLQQHMTKLQIIRTDGQMLQTLFCTTAYAMSNIQWSPDERHIAFAVTGSNGQTSTIELLDLTTGQQEGFAVNNYRPYAWLNNTLLYIVQPQGNLLTSQMHLALLDTRKIYTSSPKNFTTIASANALCGTFEKSIDSTRLFTSSCTLVDVCRGPATQGPSTLSSLPATGGPAITIYHNQSQAIMTFHPVTTQTLLMYVENTQGNLNQNGLWKINTDGSGLTRLTTTPGYQCSDLGYPIIYPQIISGSQYYALRTVDVTSQNESLMVGNLNSGILSAFETKNTREGVLILIGVVPH